MKNYIKPEIKIAVLNNEAVLMVSGGLRLSTGTTFTVKSSGGYNKVNF